MIVPSKRNISFQKKHVLKREIPNGLNISIEKGKKIKEDTVIATGRTAMEKVRIDVREDLGIRDVKSSVVCLHGERIQQGDPIARKKAVVLGKDRVIEAPMSGVVDLSSIDAGIVKILNAASETTIYSGVEGAVTSIIRDQRVLIETPVFKIDVANVFGESVQGELFYIDNEHSEDIEQDFSGGVVVPDFKVDKAYLRELALAGVEGIVLGGLDSSLLTSLSDEGLWGMTVCVTEGFGNIQIHDKTLQLIRRNDGRLCAVNSDDTLILTCEADEALTNHDQILKTLSSGDSVQVFDSQYFGFYGIVESLDDTSVKVKVYRWGQERIISVDPNNILYV